MSNDTDHDYDGIKEQDNPLPRWWLLTFFGTIVFGAFYYAYYQLGPGPTLNDELAADLTKSAPPTPPQKAGPQAVEAKVAFSEEKALKVYNANCLACHLEGGKGSIGPNLTDKFWISGKGTLADVTKIIKEGVAAKGMPAWASVLSESDIAQVSELVLSFQGKTLPGAKAPQGTEIK